MIKIDKIGEDYQLCIGSDGDFYCVTMEKNQIKKDGKERVYVNNAISVRWEE